MSENINNGFESLLAETNEALKRAGEALNLAVEGMPPANDFQRNYIRQQAASIASVTLDVNLLVSHGRFENVVGLCRIGFESRINLYAAMRVPEFAAQKHLAGAKGHVEELEEIIRDGATSPLFQKALQEHRQLLDDMRRDLGGIQEKTWCKFREVVKAADLMRDYEAHYPTMSKAVHNTLTGLAAKTDDRILIRSALNLLNDAIETSAALVFFRTPGESRPRPLTTKWKELAARIPTLQDEYGNLLKRLNNLTNETFRHPES
jgi:hypothetical protein